MNIFDDDNDFKYIKNKNFGQIQTKVNNFQFYSCSSFFFFFFFFGKKNKNFGKIQTKFIYF